MQRGLSRRKWSLFYTKCDTLNTIAVNLQMKCAVEEMDEKNKVLSSWTKENVGQVDEVKNLWNNFLALLDNQQFYINRQVILSFSFFFFFFLTLWKFLFVFRLGLFD